jgi:hypothetical protein
LGFDDHLAGFVDIAPLAPDLDRSQAVVESADAVILGFYGKGSVFADEADALGCFRPSQAFLEKSPADRNCGLIAYLPVLSMKPTPLVLDPCQPS